MGNEFVVLFFPVPLVFWVYHSVCIIKGKSVLKNSVLMSLGVGFIAGMMLYEILSGFDPLRGVMVGGLFYVPGFIILWLLYSLGAYVVRDRADAT